MIGPNTENGVTADKLMMDQCTFLCGHTWNKAAWCTQLGEGAI